MVSFEFEFDEDPIEEIQESYERASGEVIFTVPYAIYVELPTEPHTPPFQPIYEWVGRQITSGSEQDSIAWAVVNKISEVGTDGVYFASDTVEQYRNGLWENVADEFAGSDNPNAPEEFIESLLEDMREDAKQNIKDADAIDKGNLISETVLIMDVDVEEGEVDISEA